MYFYHPDHLGSSTFLTDANGNAYQFFINLPFGETMAEQLPDTYYRTPYKFNGKELDEETGLYYYGARYYDPKISIWLSVDPLAERGPEYSPYCYTFNNPINLRDPDGRWPTPPKWWTRWQNRSEAEKSVPLIYSGIAYNMRYEKGSHSVGTIATNFSLMGMNSDISSTSILTPETKSNTGSQNGIRHATLSAIAYANFYDGGVSAALESHEENIKVDPNQTFFKTYNEVDMAADYKNNQFGKEIADDLGIFELATNKMIFEKVIDKAYNEGIWHGVKTKGGYELKQIKLTEGQYNKFEEALKNKDNNAEWKK